MLQNIYNSVIGDNCRIANFVEIGNAVIGNNCRIQAFSFICEGVTIEDDVFIGPHVCFTNVKRPEKNVTGIIEKTLIKSGVVIGANSTIMCGITLGKCCFIGAGSVVINDVPDYVIMVGNPAKQIERKIINANKDM
jgi:UDP-2-acetamido-3-amino-2,3-dideoxy-glucuronate N-acetyltransferase